MREGGRGGNTCEYSSHVLTFLSVSLMSSGSWGRVSPGGLRVHVPKRDKNEREGGGRVSYVSTPHLQMRRGTVI